MERKDTQAIADDLISSLLGSAAPAPSSTPQYASLPRHAGAPLIVTVNIPHVEATSKVKLAPAEPVHAAVARVRHALAAKGLLFGADLRTAFALFTLAGAPGGRRLTGALVRMQDEHTIGHYALQNGDLVYFKQVC